MGGRHRSWQVASRPTARWTGPLARIRSPRPGNVSVRLTSASGGDHWQENRRSCAAGERSGDNGVSPTIFRSGGYRFYFPREEPRMRLHVHHETGEAKFWLEPATAVAQNYGLSPARLPLL